MSNPMFLFFCDRLLIEINQHRKGASTILTIPKGTRRHAKAPRGGGKRSNRPPPEIPFKQEEEYLYEYG